MMDDTREEVHRIGHRAFIGGQWGYWRRIGNLQLRFLVDQGLSPSDTFIDVGCGSLRGGTRFIRYLEPGKYLGIDKYIELIIYGVSQELGLATYARKKPRFVISDTFEFEKFEEPIHFGIAQSLFTHLAEREVRLCLENLRVVAAPGARFFATFFEEEKPVSNCSVSHSHKRFGYTRAQMEQFGSDNGWDARYIGEWNHPRKQMMIAYHRV